MIVQLYNLERSFVYASVSKFLGVSVLKFMGFPKGPEVPRSPRVPRYWRSQGFRGLRGPGVPGLGPTFPPCRSNQLEKKEKVK